MEHFEVYSMFRDKRAKLALCHRFRLPPDVDAGTFYDRAIRDAVQRKNTGAESRSRAEYIWHTCGCPYYLVYPCILDIVAKVPTDTPILPVVVPGVRVLEETEAGIEDIVRCTAIALRLPKGVAGCGGLETAILTYQSWAGYPDKQLVTVHTAYKGPEGKTEYRDSLCFVDTDGGTSLARLLADAQQAPTVMDGNIADVLSSDADVACNSKADGVTYGVPDFDDDRVIELKLLACFGLLADDATGLLERDLLARDRGKPVTQAALDRAARLKGIGWTLGARLDSTPHLRRPHFARRWTGPGRKVPRLVPIKGSVVHRQSLTTIPTGQDA
jgi:hypothetical protein